MSVPEPVRRLFGSFPLKTRPAIPVDKKEIPEYDSSLTLYVYNIDDGKLCTDPESLECQCVFQLNDKTPLILPSSLHVSPKGKLPYIVERNEKKNSVRIYNEAKSIKIDQVKHSNLKQGQIFQSLIKISLGDAWRMTLLDSNYESIKNQIYGVNNWFESQEISKLFLHELESRYSSFVTRYNSIYYNTISSSDQTVDTIKLDILAQVKDCLQVFETLLTNEGSGQQKQFIHGEQIGREDIMLFSYIYLIDKYVGDSDLGQLIRQDHPRIINHSKLVYNELF